MYSKPLSAHCVPAMCIISNLFSLLKSFERSFVKFIIPQLILSISLLEQGRNRLVSLDLESLLKYLFFPVNNLLPSDEGGAEGHFLYISDLVIISPTRPTYKYTVFAGTYHHGKYVVDLLSSHAVVLGLEILRSGRKK